MEEFNISENSLISKMDNLAFAGFYIRTEFIYNMNPGHLDFQLDALSLANK